MLMSVATRAQAREDPGGGSPGPSLLPEVPSGAAAVRRREGCGGRRLLSGARRGGDRAVEGDVAGPIGDRMLSAAPARPAREGAQEGERRQALGVGVGEHGALE